MHSQSKQNDELNQVWLISRKVLKALETSKGIERLSSVREVIKVINQGGSMGKEKIENKIR